MGVLSDNMRARANELDRSLAALMAKPTVNPDVVAAIKASVLPEMFLAMADMLNVLEIAKADQASERMRRYIQRNSAVRDAVTKGDRDELGRILDGIIAGSAADA